MNEKCGVVEKRKEQKEKEKRKEKDAEEGKIRCEGASQGDSELHSEGVGSITQR